MPTGLAQNLSFILLGEDRTASKSMTAAQATAERVTGRIGGAFSKLGGIIGGEFGGILQQAGSSIEDIGAKGIKLSTVLEAGGGIATGAGIGLMQLGSGAQQASDQLKAAVVSNGDSFDHFSSQIDAAVKKGESFDFSAEDTKQALTNLIPATGSTAAALSEMSVVTNLAASRHMSLADASTQVAKILQGSGARTLTQYGIAMDGVGTKTQQGQQALDQLSKKLDGQATASMKNFGKQVDADKTTVTDWAKEIAGPAGTALTIIGPALSTVGVILDLHKSKLQQNTLAQIALNTASEDAVVPLEDATGATAALDGAMDANPIGAVGAALGIVAGIVTGGALLGGLDAQTQKIEGLTQAYKADNDEIGKNTRLQVVNDLQKSGSLKDAETAGVDPSLLVDVALGQAGAQAKLNAVLEAGKQKLQDSINFTGLDAKQRDLAQRSTDNQKKALDGLLTSANSENGAVKATVANQKLVSRAMDDTAGSAAYAAGELNILQSSYDALSKNAPASVSYSVIGGTKKVHAAGGSFIANSPTMLTPYDQVGEAGPERVDITPLNAGRQNTGGTTTVVNVTVNAHGMMASTAAEASKMIHTLIINGIRQGNSASELRQALRIKPTS